VRNSAWEENLEPSTTTDRGIDTVLGTVDSVDALALEIAAAARTRLIDVEVVLRDSWYDSIDHTPLVAARINVAARLVHQAVEALSPLTLCCSCRTRMDAPTVQ
jgi:hypothetical protein